MRGTPTSVKIQKRYPSCSTTMIMTLSFRCCTSLMLVVFLCTTAISTMAWVVSPPPQRTTSFALYSGYLDNLSRELRQEPSEDKEDEYDDQRRQSMNLDEEQVDRFGVGSWDSYVDFSEFDGGDGQMGVAGDGKEGLDKEWEDNKSAVMKSRSMSAKVAWGANTGYAEELRAKGVETSRAQQMENWMNQQELQKMRHDQRYMTEEFDSTTSKDEDWRKLASFGVERNQDFDLDETFGAVTPGTTIYHHIQLNTRINRAEVFEFNLLNSFMGYSDFRARFTPETPTNEWSVEPSEGSLNGKKGTDFIVKYRPQSPGTSTGYLVIQTDEDKWTFQVTGSASM